jgi:hypothetical protein
MAKQGAVKCDPDDSETGSFSREDEKAILRAMIKLQEPDVDLTAQAYWEDIAGLSVSWFILYDYLKVSTFLRNFLLQRLPGRSWHEIKRHYFHSLCSKFKQYLTEEEAAELTKRLSAGVTIDIADDDVMEVDDDVRTFFDIIVQCLIS